jgi:hypothetical protein
MECSSLAVHSRGVTSVSGWVFTTVGTAPATHQCPREQACPEPVFLLLAPDVPQRADLWRCTRAAAGRARLCIGASSEVCVGQPAEAVPRACCAEKQKSVCLQGRPPVRAVCGGRPGPSPCWLHAFPRPQGPCALRRPPHEPPELPAHIQQCEGWPMPLCLSFLVVLPPCAGDYSPSDLISNFSQL